jgi:hypothetical protein
VAIFPESQVPTDNILCEQSVLQVRQPANVDSRENNSHLATSVMAIFPESQVPTDNILCEQSVLKVQQLAIMLTAESVVKHTTIANEETKLPTWFPSPSPPRQACPT